MFGEIAWAMLWVWIGATFGYLLGAFCAAAGRESREEEELQAGGLPLPQNGQTRWEPRK